MELVMNDVFLQIWNKNIFGTEHWEKKILQVAS